MEASLNFKLRSCLWSLQLHPLKKLWTLLAPAHNRWSCEKKNGPAYGKQMPNWFVLAAGLSPCVVYSDEVYSIDIELQREANHIS
jgi:hypothetical protein